MTAEPTVARTLRDLVVVEGPDAAAYLQGQLSQDVAALAVGASAATFVLAPQGKVDGWGRIHRAADDRFEIDVDPGAGSVWAARLQRFLLRTKAEISVADEVATIEIRGAVVEGARAPLGPNVVGGDVVGWAESGPPPGTPEGAVVIDADEAEALRIRAGVPRWGRELDGDTIPATLGQWAIDASVSFTKGCYTGQELVARIDSRGGNVPRLLVGVRSTEAFAAGEEVTVGEAPAGIVTSAAVDPEGGWVGLVFAPRSVEVAPDGTPATVAGHDAQLRSLPLG